MRHISPKGVDNNEFKCTVYFRLPEDIDMLQKPAKRLYIDSETYFCVSS